MPLDTVDPIPPILCKGMAEHLRDKKFSVMILWNSHEDPFNKYGNGEEASGR
jgi:hypothetical protein